MGLKLFVILVAPILKCYPNSKGILLDFSEAHDESAKATLSQYRKNLDSVMIDYGQTLRKIRFERLGGNDPGTEPSEKVWEDQGLQCGGRSRPPYNPIQRSDDATK